MILLVVVGHTFCNEIAILSNNGRCSHFFRYPFYEYLQCFDFFLSVLLNSYLIRGIIDLLEYTYKPTAAGSTSSLWVRFSARMWIIGRLWSIECVT